MKKIISILAVVVVIVLVIWAVSSKKSAVVPEVGQPAAEEQADTASEDTLLVNLFEQNNSGESGTAALTLIEAGTKIKVTLGLTGAPAGVKQPAHIHTGSCAQIGNVVYPLNFPIDGVSETILDVTPDIFIGQLPLALNVHKSAEEASVYVACGDIALQ